MVVALMLSVSATADSMSSAASVEQTYALLHERKRRCIFSRKARASDAICNPSMVPFATDRDLECYADRYAELRPAGNEGHVDHLRLHWAAIGHPEGRNVSCSDDEMLSTISCTAAAVPAPTQRLPPSNIMSDQNAIALPSEQRPATTSRSPCRGVTSTVILVVPRRGLAYQRLRMVQDIVMAKLSGAAVIMPDVLMSRRGCHFQLECSTSFAPALPLWDIFDKLRTVKALRDAGVCVRSKRNEAGLVLARQREPPVRSWPIVASSIPGLTSQGLLNGTWSWGNETVCCALLVPNTEHSQHLTALVNAAFVSSAKINRIADAVLRQKELQTKGVTGRVKDATMHWRDDDDFINSVHKLNMKRYVSGMLNELDLLRHAHDQKQKLSEGAQLTAKTTQLLMLGDFKPKKRLKNLHGKLDYKLCECGALNISSSDINHYNHYKTKTFRHKLILMSKESVLKGRETSHAAIADWITLEPYDDLKGQIDFELGVRANAFIGRFVYLTLHSPFSAFSVAIALVRRAKLVSESKTLMGLFDLNSHVGISLAILFPYSSLHRSRNDPCTDLMNTNVFIAKASITGRALQPCPMSLQDLELRAKHELALTDQEERARMALQLPPVALQPVMGTSRDARQRHPECIRFAPGFHFEPAVDAPERLGYRCTLAVVTAVFGADKDPLPEYSRLFERVIKETEDSSAGGRRSCWFAFTNRAAIEFAVRNRTLSSTQANNCIAAGKHLKIGIWNIVPLSPEHLPFGSDQSGANSRVPKLLSHCVIRHATHVLYVDAKLSLVNPVRLWPMFTAFTTGSTHSLRLVHQTTQRCEKEHKRAPSKCARPLEVPVLKQSQKDGTDQPESAIVRPAWISPVHPSRYTLGQEAFCVFMLGLARVEMIQEQLGEYRRQQFPMNERADAGGAGLLEGEWHFRDLRQPTAIEIGNIWFGEFSTWLRLHGRDQLSANYAIWKSGALNLHNANGTFMYADYSTYMSQRPPSPRVSILLPGTRRHFWREHPHELSKKVRGRKLVSKPFARHTSECDWAQYGLANFQRLQAERGKPRQMRANSTLEAQAKSWIYSDFRKLRTIRKTLGTARDWFS